MNYQQANQTSQAHLVLDEQSRPKVKILPKRSLSSVLVATLGSEPQVIALAAQLLQKSVQDLGSVIVLHTKPSQEPVSAALPALESAFAAHSNWPTLQTVQIPALDVISPAELTCFSDVLYNILKRELISSHSVHLLLAGGRKPMAMIGTTVAQMLFGPNDRLWYLYSDNSLRASRRFELEEGDQAQLVQISLPQISPFPPLYSRSFQADSPTTAHEILTQEQKRKLVHFVENDLTKAERTVAGLLAKNVMTVKEIATYLHKSPKTVTNQLNSVYSKLESVFGLQPDIGVKREFLRRELGGYFRSEELS